MQVIGYVQYLPGTNFSCPGGGPANGSLTKRVCRSSTSDNLAIYEVFFLTNATGPSRLTRLLDRALPPTTELPRPPSGPPRVNYVKDLALKGGRQAGVLPEGLQLEAVGV
jgi:hypothetical protein